jgi:hypothetical protein
MAGTLNIPPRIRRPFSWVAWAGIVLVMAGAALALYFIDPSRQSLFPQCQFHRLTGWWCPGCGGTRALHQLLHGEFVAAFLLNPLLVLALPVLAYWLVRVAVAERTGRRLPFFRWHRAWGWGLLLLVALFFVARNVSLPGLTWLRL